MIKLPANNPPEFLLSTEGLGLREAGSTFSGSPLACTSTCGEAKELAAKAASTADAGVQAFLDERAKKA